MGMKNKTLYDVLNQVMDDYCYAITKTGREIFLSGKIRIKKLNEVVSYDKKYIIDDDDTDKNMEIRIRQFKEEVKEKVAEKLKEHKEELLDDDYMIERLWSENISLNADNERLRKQVEELTYSTKKMDERIRELEENPKFIGVPAGIEQPYCPPPGTTGYRPYANGLKPEIWCSSSTDEGKNEGKIGNDSWL